MTSTGEANRARRIHIRQLQKCVHITVPVAGLIACVCGVILVLGVVSSGVLSLMSVFIPCVIIGGAAGLWLIVGTLIGSFIFTDQAGEPVVHRLRTRPSTTAVRRRLDVVERLPRIDSVDEEDEEGRTCSICLCEAPPERVILNCGHKFHEGCVKEWMGRARLARCPLCRSGLGTGPLAPEGDTGSPPEGSSVNQDVSTDPTNPIHTV